MLSTTFSNDFQASFALFYVKTSFQHISLSNTLPIIPLLCFDNLLFSSVKIEWFVHIPIRDSEFTHSHTRKFYQTSSCVSFPPFPVLFPVIPLTIAVLFPVILYQMYTGRDFGMFLRKINYTWSFFPSKHPLMSLLVS